MSVDFVSYVIGAGQFALLLGIFLRLGKVMQRQADHEDADEKRFSRLERSMQHV